MRSEEEAIDFLTRLVEKIDMKIIKGPFASYVDKEGVTRDKLDQEGRQ